MISITSDISLYFHCSVFWITSDFSIHLMHFTSELQTPIAFLFANENIKCGIFWYQNYLGLLKFFVFAFSAPPFSVGEPTRGVQYVMKTAQ